MGSKHQATKNGISDGKQQSEHTEATMNWNEVAEREGDRLVFVFRASWRCNWKLIESKLEHGMKREISLFPVGEDRAILECSLDEEKTSLIKEGRRLGGDLKINLEQAIIKVRRKWKGFFPTKILLPCGPKSARLRIGRLEPSEEAVRVVSGVPIGGEETVVKMTTWQRVPSRGERTEKHMTVC
ncbi:hypothetical protein Scep_002782 [Stephania cephalantha]|uniref:Uncharacterized protein n=1 Tax=Stephania cephalantha TaxID=152367 RepID=A0AAP0Q939_9MAGN